MKSVVLVLVSILGTIGAIALIFRGKAPLVRIFLSRGRILYQENLAEYSGDELALLGGAAEAVADEVHAEVEERKFSSKFF